MTESVTTEIDVAEKQFFELERQQFTKDQLIERAKEFMRREYGAATTR